MREYLAIFRGGKNKAVDYYKDNGKLIKHSWNGGKKTKQEVSRIPNKLKSMRRTEL